MPHKTKLVAIINLTPDSFSDGGQYEKPADAIRAIRQAIDDGADVIDIGAESTRPGAALVKPDEEWERLRPVLEEIRHFNNSGVQFSLDTRHATTARRGIDHGVDWVNDVSGFSSGAMVQAVASSSCKLVVMHSLSVPADKSLVLPGDCDPVEKLLSFAQRRFSQLKKAGIDRSRLIFDPGIGFGKTASQSWDILNRAEEFAALHVPVFIGHSRKSFLAEANDQVQDRDELTVNISRELVAKHIDYLRVHNVALHKRMLESVEHSA